MKAASKVASAVSFVLIPFILAFGSSSGASDQKKPRFNGHVQEIISESSTWEKGATVWREISKYDRDGRVLETGTGFWKMTVDGLLREERVGKLFYDKQGRHIKTINTFPDGTVNLIITFAYDDRGNLIDQTSLDKDGTTYTRLCIPMT